jgi:zinc/manganese transport system substrate-binding protein
VVGGDEVVPLGGGRDPVVEAALIHLDDAMTALTQQMVVMRDAAEPVALLTAVVGEDVDHAGIAEQRECAVDGRQPCPRVALAKASPELLRGDVVALARELLEHLEPARRRTDAAPLQQARQVLRRLGHANYPSHVRMRTVLVIGGTTTLLAACGSSTNAAGKLDVVAAENVYGNIASQIGGRHVSVTSILTDPNADPHLFEPGTASGLAVAGAKVVIENGLGYDAFMARLETAAPSKDRVVLTIARILGIHGKNANPHLWYDIPQLDRVASAIAAAFARADPSHAVAYRRDLHRFERSLRPLRREIAGIRTRFQGAPVAYTEPVPGYLVAAAGLHNVAPSAYTRAIEDGTEPAPAAVSAMNVLVAKRRIRVLLYNSQAVSPITKSLEKSARSARIPVVPVTETLPPGLTFEQWQLGQARMLASALGKT